ENEDMPPPKAEALAAGEGESIKAWISGSLNALAAEFSGDPGPVTMRRLTNGEYDRTIRDLTGRDYGLAKEFQTEAGGGEGFSNIGDVLFLSPAALDKYFNAARQLADHATIMPGTGLVFHDHRIGLRGPDQLKAHAEQGLYVWYQQKAAPHLPGDFDDMREGDYLLACWKHRYFQTPLDVLAKEAGLKLPFLQNWWNLVNSTEPKSRFLDLTRVRWRELPGPDAAKPKAVPEAVAKQIAIIREDHLSWNNPKKPGSGIQRRQQDADGIRAYPMVAEVKGQAQVHLCIGDIGDGNAGDIAMISKIDVKLAKGSVNYFDWLKKRIEAAREELAATPPPGNAEDLKKRVAELEPVLSAFGKHPQDGRKIEPQVLALAAPRVFTLPLPEGAVQVRAETRLDMQNPEVDQATIQWTMTTGTPRDVKTIMPGVLTIWKVRSDAARRTMGDFGVMKQAFPDMFERRLEMVARNLYRSTPGYTVYYFSDEQLGELLGERDKAQLVAMKKDWRCASPRDLNANLKKEYDEAMAGHLHQFASRAWRRPLIDSEKASLAALYQDGLTKGLDRESAAREVVVRILVSPHFLFKAETLPAAEAAEGLTLTDEGDLPLSAWEVASRLSYFLWSSLPDWELRKAAGDGSLLKPEVLSAQAKRMLKDPRSSSLAYEFAGQWLKFDGFDTHDGVDGQKFPEMTPEIRGDMHREAIEYFTRFFREDGRVSDVVIGETTFLNERLAKFYGVPGVTGNEFREVDVSQYHRGGLLGMGAILTKTSRPHRTSPVVRGEYLNAVVLGNHSPPPPASVPKLDESSLKPASLREALMIHREDKACSVCHDRIDPLGFALEAYDPIGRFRSTDDSGDAIDDSGSLKDGTVLKGMEGLRAYLAENDGEFSGNFSRKLLGYALGREVLPSDAELLNKMQDSLEQNGGTVSALITEIVTSRQFLNRRHELPVVTSNP
ncbi:MAG: DUF1592 domain-containing protein, partial [Verrucomicrobiae bacterium]|nr:DUF1592 domain-containing protein [Verrucomicrobiae bacterium]